MNKKLSTDINYYTFSKRNASDTFRSTLVSQNGMVGYPNNIHITI